MLLINILKLLLQFYFVFISLSKLKQTLKIYCILENFLCCRVLLKEIKKNFNLNIKINNKYFFKYNFFAFKI